MRITLLLTVCFSALASLAIAQQGASEASFRAGDTFELRIAGVPSEEVAQVTAPYTVDGDGFVNLPHLGKVRAVNMTASQLQTSVENAYKSAQIYTNPTVTILTQASALFVNIGGEVKGPSRVPYTPDLTLLKAITAVGDFTEFADQKKVRVLRGKEVMVVDVRRIRKDPGQDVKLLPGDQVVVPRSFW